MSAEGSRFVNVCPVLISRDIKKTVQFYTDKLGFTAATHYDKPENFATLYRDEIEFVVVQAKRGDMQPNTQRYGSGYDAYIDTAAPEGIDTVFEEFKARGVKIVSTPHKTAYGSYEFVFEDVDGRQIGLGKILDTATYFRRPIPADQ